jgi:signal transduction histidine kinase/CheY-like chemotaxis protein
MTTGDLRRARREAEELARIARFLTETLDVATVGNRVVESVRDLFEVPAAGLRLREADGSLVMLATAGGEKLYWPVCHRAPPTFGFYRYVVDTGQPLRITDLLDEGALPLGDDVRQRIQGSEVRSLLAVPLRVQQHITGVLSIAARAGRVFSDDDVALLGVFADQAALALQNSRSHAEVLRRQQEAEELARVAGLVSETLDLTTVGERIAEGVLGLLDVHSSALRLLEPDGSLVAIALGGRAKSYADPVSVVPLGVGLIGWAAAKGEPFWTSDFRTDDRFATSPELRARNAEAGTVAGLAVPLRVAGKVTGVLSVGHGTSRTFSEGEVALVQAFANQAASAINNAQIQGALARQAERLRILHEIDRALIAQQAPVAIAETVVPQLRILLGVPRVIVNLFDLESGHVEWLAAAGRRRTYSGPEIRYSLRLAGDLRALARGEPQRIDVRSLGASPEADALLASGVTVYLVVPMIAGGELIGSVSLGNTTGEFPPEHIAIAQEVATQLAIVVAQARLNERVIRQAAELERRVEERTRALSDATAEADRANRAKSEFLSRMSHELRTPLNAILGFAQLLKMDAMPAGEAESVDQILRAGRHLLGLINEVLEISRIEARHLQISLEPVSVQETLRQAVDLVRPAASGLHVAVRVAVTDEQLHVLADRQRLQQVFLNVLSNAVKYNRPGGAVTISCECAPTDRLRIHISDTGRGIPADKLARLFTPFDRLGAEATGVEGTGLGLALSKHLVDAMQGTIWVQSEAGVGSTFSVELPLVPEPVEIDQSLPGFDGPSAGDGRARRLKVLHIEDNPSNLRLVERIFCRRPAVTLVSAIQGRVGLELARDHQPDLILLDRHLPDLTGDEVLQRLRDDARTAHIPVVLLSADASSDHIRRLLATGARAYLVKPLDVDRLLEIVDEIPPRDGP